MIPSNANNPNSNGAAELVGGIAYIAVDTPGGLIVPSIKHADQLSLRGVAATTGVALKVRREWRQATQPLIHVHREAIARQLAVVGNVDAKLDLFVNDVDDAVADVNRQSSLVVRLARGARR